MRTFSDERRDFNLTYAVESLREWIKQMKDDGVGCRLFGMDV